RAVGAEAGARAGVAAGHREVVAGLRARAPRLGVGDEEELLAREPLHERRGLRLATRLGAPGAVGERDAGEIGGVLDERATPVLVHARRHLVGVVLLDETRRGVGEAARGGLAPPVLEAAVGAEPRA